MNLFRLFLKHKHKFQERAVNRYGTCNYQVCTGCGLAQKRVNKIGEDDRFENCERMPEFDSQFDENNNYIFN